MKTSTPITEEFSQTLNNCYIQVEAIAQSKEWSDLLRLEAIDPEANSHLGDVLHYLCEAIACLDEAKKDLVQQVK